MTSHGTHVQVGPNMQTRSALHTKGRAKNRHGLELRTRDLIEMVRMIRERKKQFEREMCGLQVDDPVPARYLSKLSCTRYVWEVYYKGHWLTVIYSSSSDQIITILPKDSKENPSQKDV